MQIKLWSEKGECKIPLERVLGVDENAILNYILEKHGGRI
jgi:hypothetical protein